MPRLIGTASRVTAAGSPPKTIDEYVVRVNTGAAEVSVAHMRRPSGWAEPGQTAPRRTVSRPAPRNRRDSGADPR